MSLPLLSIRVLALLLLFALGCSSDGDTGSSGAGDQQATSGRFQDCGDGTLLDTTNNLQWETKTGDWPPGASDIKGCSVTQSSGAGLYRPCPETRDVVNRYTYCANLLSPSSRCDQCGRPANTIRPTGPRCDDGVRDLKTGSVFTDFIDVLNDNGQPGGCFAGHCDWQLPTGDQLTLIMVGEGSGPGQPKVCIPGIPCIDGAFSDTPTAEFGSYYLTSDSGLPAQLNLGNQSECRNQSPCQTAGNFGIGALNDRTATMNIPTYARAMRVFDPLNDSCGP